MYVSRNNGKVRKPFNSNKKEDYLLMMSSTNLLYSVLGVKNLKKCYLTPITTI